MTLQYLKNCLESVAGIVEELFFVFLNFDLLKYIIMHSQKLAVQSTVMFKFKLFYHFFKLQICKFHQRYIQDPFHQLCGAFFAKIVSVSSSSTIFNLHHRCLIWSYFSLQLYFCFVRSNGRNEIFTRYEIFTNFYQILLKRNLFCKFQKNLRKTTEVKPFFR